MHSDSSVGANLEKNNNDNNLFKKSLQNFQKAVYYSIVSKRCRMVKFAYQFVLILLNELGYIIKLLTAKLAFWEEFAFPFLIVLLTRALSCPNDKIVTVSMLSKLLKH